MNKVGVVKNPLSVIAIFAGVAEISGTSVLPFISSENQKLYIYFLISFPFTLVILFFATLNWNHKALYAPSDFESDESFLESAKTNTRRNDIASMEKIIEEKIGEAINIELGSDEAENNQNLARKITESIKNSTFITVDARQITGGEDDVFELPFVAVPSLGHLTDEVFYLLNGTVRAFEYGHSWVLKDQDGGRVIKNARMITGSDKGKPLSDNRALEEVGIFPGTALVVAKV